MHVHVDLALIKNNILGLEGIINSKASFFNF